ncbi:MAG TPA: type I methionyl aminopeptidase [Candidatus Uhrbacteria bacterium]|nr:type I methionyl aminopeptidase [Candidatus Uhrbacteria bacterium]
MIIYKTQKEIELMAESGKILARVLNEIVQNVKPGVNTQDLEDFAEKLIADKGGRPAFKNYKAYPEDKAFPTALCASINDEVVHAPAIPGRILREGDIIGLDLGVEYKGYFSDMAVTIGVGKISVEAQKLLNITKAVLGLGIEQFKEGNTLADIGRAIQFHAEKNGFSVVRELVGHGVGKQVHEDPRVPNYFTEEAKFVPIKRGMTIAIEPMINTGSWEIKLLDDGWTFATADGSLSAQFEHTVALDRNGKKRILTL